MSDEIYCNLNGRVQTCAETPFSSADDTFRLRYGLYETYLCEKGKPQYAALHWERLKKGLDVLGFTTPGHLSAPFFTAQTEELLARNKHRDLSRIRLQVFTEDNTAPYTIQFLVESFPLEKSVTGWLENGIRIGVLDGFQKEITAVANCKISHNRHFVPARNMMEGQSLDDVLLLNTKGRVAESAMANLFWIKNRIVFTPPLSEGCLAGTIRAVLIDCLRSNDIPLMEQACTLEDLNTADEIFLSNSIRKMRWVREMEGQKYKNEMTRQLYDLFLAQETNRL
jgi:branched-chain amino acid aminotransferase